MSYKIKKVKGDGNCAFRAIAKGMLENLSKKEEKEKANEFRQLVVELLQKNKDKIIGDIGLTIEQIVLMKDDYSDFEEYCEAMKNYEYAGETEFLLLSSFLKISISIFSGKEFKHLITYNQEDSSKEILLYWKKSKNEENNHYDYLVSV